MQENFLHTSVRCCTSAGKFPAHTVKIWIFLSSAGNMIPALQPPNTGALSHRLSILISFGTCSMLETLLGKVILLALLTSPSSPRPAVSQATPFTERGRVWSRCNYRVVAEERNYRPLRLGNKMLTSAKHVVT